jgi:hypothetical protein
MYMSEYCLQPTRSVVDGEYICGKSSILDKREFASPYSLENVQVDEDVTGVRLLRCRQLDEEEVTNHFKAGGPQADIGRWPFMHPGGKLQPEGIRPEAPDACVEVDLEFKFGYTADVCTDQSGTTEKVGGVAFEVYAETAGNGTYRGLYLPIFFGRNAEGETTKEELYISGFARSPRLPSTRPEKPPTRTTLGQYGLHTAVHQVGHWEVSSDIDGIIESELESWLNKNVSLGGESQDWLDGPLQYWSNTLYWPMVSSASWCTPQWPPSLPCAGGNEVGMTFLSARTQVSETETKDGFLLPGNLSSEDNIKEIVEPQSKIAWIAYTPEGDPVIALK